MFDSFGPPEPGDILWKTPMRTIRVAVNDAQLVICTRYTSEARVREWIDTGLPLLFDDSLAFTGIAVGNRAWLRRAINDAEISHDK